jgi:hypothetical protein
MFCAWPILFDGAVALLSSAKYLHRCGALSFLLNLEFFHVCDWVSIHWLDRILNVMGFGAVLRHWVTTLHFPASACFLLQTLSPDMAMELSIRQEDPVASVFFGTYVEPFMVCLGALLGGHLGDGVREASLGYIDDVDMLKGL